MFKERITKLTETLSEFRNLLWLFGSWVYHHWKMDCKRNADAPWFLISCSLLKLSVAQVLSNVLQNVESVETLQFQNFIRSLLEVTHSRQKRIRFWGPFTTSVFKLQRMGHVPGKPPNVWKKEKSKAEGDFSFKLKNKKLTSRKCRVTAERLPQQLRFSDFKLGALRSRLLG